jgi:hypothetical protein
MSHSLNHPWFQQPNSMKGRVAIMELPTVIFSPSSSYFIFFVGLIYNSAYIFKHS